MPNMLRFGAICSCIPIFRPSPSLSALFVYLSPLPFHPSPPIFQRGEQET